MKKRAALTWRPLLWKDSGNATITASAWETAFLSLRQKAGIHIRKLQILRHALLPKLFAFRKRTDFAEQPTLKKQLC